MDMEYKQLENLAWNYYSSNKCQGNAMYTTIGYLEFNGKETITLFDAAEKGREEFNKVFKHRYDMFHYWEKIKTE